MTDPQKFAELQRWADTWWCEELAGVCGCGAQGQGPRHHEIRCIYFGIAWELKARDLVRGGAPGDGPVLNSDEYFPEAG